MIISEIVKEVPQVNPDPLASFSFGSSLLGCLIESFPRGQVPPDERVVVDLFAGNGAVGEAMIAKQLVRPCNLFCVDRFKPVLRPESLIPPAQWRSWELSTLSLHIGHVDPGDELPPEITRLMGQADVVTALQAEGFGSTHLAKLVNYLLKPGGVACLDFPNDIIWRDNPPPPFGCLVPHPDIMWWIKR